MRDFDGERVAFRCLSDSHAFRPASVHSVGAPISHALKNGFRFGRDAAELSVGAVDEAESGPGASAAWRGSWSTRLRSVPSGFVPLVAMPGVSFQSRLLGVLQPTSCASAGSAPFA